MSPLTDAGVLEDEDEKVPKRLNMSTLFCHLGWDLQAYKVLCRKMNQRHILHCGDNKTGPVNNNTLVVDWRF